MYSDYKIHRSFKSNLTRLYLIYIYIYNFKNILYNFVIYFFTHLPKWNPNPKFSSYNLCWFDLYSWLFGYKFALICGSVVLIFNLILIIAIKKKICPIQGPTWSTWVGLDWIVFTYYDRLGWKVHNPTHVHPWLWLTENWNARSQIELFFFFGWGEQIELYYLAKHTIQRPSGSKW